VFPLVVDDAQTVEIETFPSTRSAWGPKVERTFAMVVVQLEIRLASDIRLNGLSYATTFQANDF